MSQYKITQLQIWPPLIFSSHQWTGAYEKSAKHRKHFWVRSLVDSARKLADRWIRSPFSARRKLAVFSQRNGLSNISRGKKTLRWQNLSTTVDKFSFADITRSYRHHPQHCKQMRSAHWFFFCVVTSFYLDKTKLKNYNLLLLAPSSSRQLFYCAGTPSCSR